MSTVNTTRYLFITLPAYGHILQIQKYIQNLSVRDNVSITVWTSKKFAPFFEKPGVEIYLYNIDEALFVFDENPVIMSMHLEDIARKITQDAAFIKSIVPADIVYYDVQARWAPHGIRLANYTGDTCSYGPSFVHNWKTWLPASLHPAAITYWLSIVRFCAQYVMQYGYKKGRDIFSKIQPPYASSHMALIPKYLQSKPSDQSVLYTVFLDEDTQKIKQLNIDTPRMYISLGTVYSSVEIINQIIQDTFEVYPGAHITVSVSGDITKLEHIYKNTNVYIYNFVDQIKVLGESDIFITHAGTNGVLESVQTLTPMICFPQAVDQFTNAHLVKKNRLGEYPWCSLYTSRAYKKSLKKVVDNFLRYSNQLKKYKEKIPKHNNDFLYSYIKKTSKN